MAPSGREHPLISYARSLKADPAERINFTWYLTLLLCGILVITATVVAVDLDEDGEESSRGAAFAAIWSMLMMIALCVGGTIVLRKFRNDMMIGVLLGVVVMMSQMMLMLFAVFAGMADDNRGHADSDRAMSAFSFVISFVLIVFAAVLFYDRESVLANPAAPPTSSAGGDKPEAPEPSDETPVAAVVDSTQPPSDKMDAAVGLA
mmetsp:Transcript_10380/g.33203  ORF Transcript_10380/g.33203 Transcript_10380/m.33203 type:complete len:205 (-) Transcript_10380:121-735(-)